MEFFLFLLGQIYDEHMKVHEETPQTKKEFKQFF